MKKLYELYMVIIVLISMMVAIPMTIIVIAYEIARQDIQKFKDKHKEYFIR